MNHTLWDSYRLWQENYQWIDLSYSVNEETPHWYGFSPLRTKTIYDFSTDGFWAQEFTTVGQYGTHVDAPVHFIEGAVGMDAFSPADMVLPLCVLDFSKEADENPDFTLLPMHIEQWEAAHGAIPEGAFVAFRTDWYLRGGQEAMENRLADGEKHYPGWSVEALRYLVEVRKVAAIGHELFDTDPWCVTREQGMVGETYILKSGRFQVELLKNLDCLPPTGALIFCPFPNITGGTGFPLRVFALSPKM